MRLLAPAASVLLLAACATAPVSTDPQAVAESVAQAAAAAPLVNPALPPSQQAAAPQPQGPGEDPFLWLEQVEGERALAWVREQNARSETYFKGDSRYEGLRREALAILTARDRIPTPSFRGASIDNFWQDQANPRGLWRTTTLASYRSANPRWETVLDIDALGKAEGRPWVFKGDTCLKPAERYCLVNLSNGGKDAVVVREFDTQTKQFVRGGFDLPEGKHRLAWVDANTLAVATEFASGELTESGYPFIVKMLTRGQPLSAAREVFRGTRQDGGYGVRPEVLRGAGGRVDGVIVARPVSTFEAEHHLLTDAGPLKLNLPMRAEYQDYVDGQAVFTVQEAWGGFGQGALIAYDLAALRRNPATARPALILQPNARQAIQSVSATDGKLLVSLLEDVKGAVDVYDLQGGRWTRSRLPLPQDATLNLVAASGSSDRAFVTSQGLLSPSTLYFADAAAGRVESLKTSPERFNAARHVVEQFWATSRDGTRIPYFLVRPREATGPAPTLVYGYGGFEAAQTPRYLPEMGKLWLERGGAYVLANIRGGGEFGPAWHQSVLREKRQGAFDDFAAVAEDLVRRGVTTPDRLGIYGRSNGGVLTSVLMTQRPELMDAAVIESPLIDMLRYHELPAGASWMGEYGDPRVPADYAFIAKYSAYQNLKPGQKYPEPYITTNTRDDRVHPGHARKYAAKLQAMGYPAVYFENTEGGHSNDVDPLMNAERWARHYVYLSKKLMD